MAEEAPQGAVRRERMREEIARLEDELRRLAGQERGVLGELDRLGAELRLRQAEHRRTTIDLADVEAAMAQRGSAIERLEREQTTRLRYLCFRHRELYKEGPQRALRRVLGGADAARFVDGLRLAAYLAERDARVLREYREEAGRLRAEQLELEAQRAALQALRVELEGARARLETARAGRERMLRRIRSDRATRQTALAELDRAATELGKLVEGLGPAGDPSPLDVHKFRGLLEWPARGRIGAGFGSVVHPRFGTTVPHPGIDIEAPAGSDISSVFDGRVVFASWIRGYGLTAIVDHGRGVLSVYAHAAALWVEPGQQVLGRQRLGLIGDTGSLRGPLLYFELRVDGRPVDPRGWLRPP